MPLLQEAQPQENRARYGKAEPFRTVRGQSRRAEKAEGVFIVFCPLGIQTKCSDVVG